MMILAIAILAVIVAAWWLERSRKPQIRDLTGRSCSLALAIRRQDKNEGARAAITAYSVSEL